MHWRRVGSTRLRQLDLTNSTFNGEVRLVLSLNPIILDHSINQLLMQEILLYVCDIRSIYIYNNRNIPYPV